MFPKKVRHHFDATVLFDAEIERGVPLAVQAYVYAVEGGVEAELLSVCDPAGHDVRGDLDPQDRHCIEAEAVDAACDGDSEPSEPVAMGSTERGYDAADARGA
jgi:hypothetical protein